MLGLEDGENLDEEDLDEELEIDEEEVVGDYNYIQSGIRHIED